MRSFVVFAGALALVATGCQNPKPETKADLPKIELRPAPSFNADSAMALVSTQVHFGPRVPGTPPHKACGDWFVARLKNCGARVTEQRGVMPHLHGKDMPIRNIIASFGPDKTGRVLLCAHYDSRYMADRDTVEMNKPISGANDGASGVAILLELARLMAQDEPAIGVDLVLFDAEDQGRPEFPVDTINPEHYFCLGSRYWAKNPHVPNYNARYGVLLDMVGGKNAQFTLEYSSMQAAQVAMTNMWDIASVAGFGDRFSYRKTRPIINDHTYINEIRHLPTFIVIEFDPGTNTNFYKHWHTQNDGLENMSSATLKAVGQTLTHVVYNEQ